MRDIQDYALLLSTGPGVGGTERVVLGLARGLQDQSVRVQTIFPQVDGETGACFLAEEMGVPIQVSPAVRSFRVSRRPCDVKALRDLVRSTRAGVVNIHFGNNRISIWDTLAIRLAGAGRCVATVHHAIPLRTPRARLLTALASRLCARVVVTTPALTGILSAAGVPARRIVEIPLGLRPPAAPPDRAEARRLLGLPQGALVVGSLGRLAPSKGFDDLIAAVAQLEAGPQPVHLAIGGEGPLHEALQAQARAALGERAHLLGLVADPATFYAALDVFALASHEEGFGLVFIEAGFQGVPSVAARVGGVPYAIAHQQSGLLVPDRDRSAMAGAIGQLLADGAQRRRLGEAARARAYQQFSEQTMAERYRRVLFAA